MLTITVYFINIEAQYLGKAFLMLIIRIIVVIFSSCQPSQF